LFDPVFEKVFGDPIDAAELANAMAVSLARLLLGGDFPYARFVQAYRAAQGSETIKFEVDVERPQKPVAAIARRELMAAIFRDDLQPVVYALRPAFPTDALHLNLGGETDPPWLCLDDRPWDEAQPRWTAFVFVERVRWWLAATARGDLHGEAQPAEPVFLTGTTVIVPPTLLREEWSDDRVLEVHAAFDDASPHTVVMREGPPDGRSSVGGFVPMFLRVQPRIMQRLRWAPQTIKQWHDLLQGWGIDLVGYLREELRRIQAAHPGLMGSRPLMLLYLPLLNVDGSPTGQADLKAFSTVAEHNLATLGIALGIFHALDGAAGSARVVSRIPADIQASGETVSTIIVSVQANFSRAAAAVGSGLTADERAIALVGAGAIGSHLIEILRRDGFGNWTIIDNDAFLPHNVQRHRGAEAFVGASKAHVTADLVNWALGTPNETKFVSANVLKASDECEIVLKRSELIIDASASIPVARFLSDRPDVSATRLSVFFNMVGTDVVLLGEDAERLTRLDALEAQYYRAVLDTAALANHIAAAGTSYQYAGACRSVSFQMPEYKVSMLTGAIAGEVRRHIETAAASITIWTRSPDDGLQRIAVPVFLIERYDIAGWQIVLDQGIVERAKALRAQALPNETGGILLGTIDVARRQICIVKLVPAPSDSFGDRAGFERGTKNLSAIVTDSSKRTAGQVEYVGEWHSHPKGVKPKASETDMKQLLWLGTERRIEALPTVMMIIGDKAKYSINVVIAA
jgi:integrative and conjugative element protein (TIGR02256 family)